MDTLKGKLLIASPAVEDWFRRCVVLVVEHTEEGAFGIVLNRRSGVEIEEAAPALAELAEPGAELYVGGPVSPQSVVALGSGADPEAAERPIVGDLALIDLENPPQGIERLRVYAGYAGWGAAQLDDEIEREVWIIEEARPGDPFSDDLWTEALRRKGGEFGLIASMPADPALN